MSRLRNLPLLLLLVFWFSNATWAIEIAPLRYSVPDHPDAFLPYAASHSLSTQDRNITRILFSIHSSGYDALQYYENARQAAAKVNGALAQTLIIAPHFMEQKVIPGRIPQGLLFWRTPPYRSSSRAAIGPDVKPISLSAYTVMDTWLDALVSSGNFPRLREIVLVGHSAGGQFVQRYAMVGKYRSPQTIQMRHVVSAPSSYAYPSGERYHVAKKEFLVPDRDVIQECSGYNNWGYGLNKPYVYFAKEDLQKIAKNYAEKRVFYLCGSKDVDPNDGSIGKGCSAMMQGAHRLERMLTFQAFLQFKYGKTVNRNHRFAVVNNVGHYGRGTMTSQAGLFALFAPLR